MRKDAGLSLIEMIIAVLILSIAVVGLFRVFDANLRDAGGQRDRALALIVAQNRAALIALQMPERPAEVRLAGQDWIVTEVAEATTGGFREVTIRVIPKAGGPAALLTTYAPGEAP